MFGILFQPGAWWIGIHRSVVEKRLCINIIPMLTVWVLMKGGKPPKRKSLIVVGRQKSVD